MNERHKIAVGGGQQMQSKSGVNVVKSSPAAEIAASTNQQWVVGEPLVGRA